MYVRDSRAPPGDQMFYEAAPGLKNKGTSFVSYLKSVN
jgi:hypothetical protein